jgi:protein-tyrosine phosphatase
MKPRRYIYEVVKSRFSAGEYPGDADDEKAKRKIDKMLRDGFTSFIDLTEEGEENYHNVPLKPYKHFLPEGIRYKRCKMTAYTLPEDMRQLLDIVDYINEQLQNGEKIYLHCRTGYDRTTVAVAAWLINNGMSVADERKEFKRIKGRNRKGNTDSDDSSFVFADDPNYMYKFHDWLKKRKTKVFRRMVNHNLSDNKITFAEFQLTDFNDISQKAHKNKAVLTNLKTGKSCRLQFVETQLLLKMLAKAGEYISYTDLADGIWTADGDEIPNLRGKLKVAIAKLKKNIASESVEISNHQYIKAYKLSLVKG